jgi:hypothetical protein
MNRKILATFLILSMTLVFGPYYNQTLKALSRRLTPSTPIYGVFMDATHTIANTSTVYPTMYNVAGTMVGWGVDEINYTLSASYNNASGPLIIYATFGLYKVDNVSGERTYMVVGTYTILRGMSTSVDVTWATPPDAEAVNGTWVIGFRCEPTGAPEAVIYPSNPDLLEVNSTYPVTIATWKFGDLGMRTNGVNTVRYPEDSDGRVTSTDLNLFLMCYRHITAPQYWWLADLGSKVPPFYMMFDRQVTSIDLAIFLIIYKGGP